MDLSGVIVVVLGILLFFGGVVWLEIRSRKNNRPARQGGHSPQTDVSTMSAEGAVRRREAESGRRFARTAKV